MKKISVFIVIITILSSLFLFSSCDNNNKNEQNFFPDEFLKENHLEDMPEINGASRVYGSKLYCNISDSQFENYVREIATFLKQKEDILDCGYSYLIKVIEGNHPGNVVTFIEDYYDYSTPFHIFVYSFNKEFENGAMIANPHTLMFDRIDGKVGGLFNRFKFNTVITFTSFPNAIYQPLSSDSNITA